MSVAPLHISIGGNGVGSIITSDTKMGGIDPDSQTPNIQSQKVHFDPSMTGDQSKFQLLSLKLDLFPDQDQHINTYTNYSYNKIIQTES